MSANTISPLAGTHRRLAGISLPLILLGPAGALKSAKEVVIKKVIVEKERVIINNTKQKTRVIVRPPRKTKPKKRPKVRPKPKPKIKKKKVKPKREILVEPIPKKKSRKEKEDEDRKPKSP